MSRDTGPMGERNATPKPFARVQGRSPFRSGLLLSRHVRSLQAGTVQRAFPVENGDSTEPFEVGGGHPKHRSLSQAPWVPGRPVGKISRPGRRGATPLRIGRSKQENRCQSGYSCEIPLLFPGLRKERGFLLSLHWFS
ncbi:MAG: hypothetical protein CM15mP130_1710 [Verrucomicrobiota bacterium]|nr:MAG: hypothetical protein CM15mP130_1710 [Verrucomicrobiota bacterium]